MAELITKILGLGFVTAILTVGFKYTFLFNYRHSYNKKKFGLLKIGLENLKKLFDEQYENSTLPAYLLQASVNEHLTTDRYSFKVIFFLMKYDALNLVEKAKEVNRAWPFLKVVELENNKVELRTKYSLEQIKKWNFWCLLVYVLIGFFLILAQLFENYINSWMTLNSILITVSSTIFIMFIAAWFGIKFTSMIVLKKMIKFNF